MSNLVRNLVRNSLLRPLIPLKDPILFMPLERNLDLVFGTGVATFTRATTATFVEKSSGLVKTAAIDTARFETNGILIEGASTNLLLRNKEFDNVAWTKTNVSISADATTSPDGTLNADQLIEDSANATHIVRQSVTYAAGAVTFSCSTKAGTGDSRNSGLTLNTTAEGALFDPTDGSVVAALGIPDDTGFEDQGNSWLRIFVTATVAAGAQDTRIYLGNGTTWTSTYQGDGIANNFIDGPQAEQLAFPSSLIETSGSTVTRALDDLSVPASNIPAPTDDYSIHMVIDVLGIDSSKSQILFNVDGETTRKIEINTTTGLIEATHGAVTSVSTTAVTPGTKINIAFTVGATNQTLYINATQEDQDAKGIVTGTATRISLGNDAGADQLFGHQSDVRIDDFELSANQVKLLL